MSGAVDRVEALVRWAHPTRGLLQPGVFLPLAEQFGLVRRLTTTVTEMAVRQCATWYRQGAGVGVSINVTVSNLLDSRLPYELAKLVNHYDLPPSMLQLEIAEDLVLTGSDQAMHTLDQLRTFGVTTAVDDFGAGRLSLTQLRSLPVREVKIHPSLVSEVAHDSADADVLARIVDLARALGMHTVAKGVDSPETFGLVQALRCDAAQGLALCPPLPGGEAIERLVGGGARLVS